MATVHLTGAAREDLRDLDGSAQKYVVKALKKLEDNPEQRGQPLGNQAGGGNLTTFRKLVVGDRDYRIVYRVEADGSVCVVWVIGKRVDQECYDLAVARLKLYAPSPELANEVASSLAALWETTSPRV
jgi:mRNA interferase RelE/StbE